MKIIRSICLLAGTCFALASAPASAMVLDVIDATDGQADTYFVPAPGMEFDDPYFRFADMDTDPAVFEPGDWGWQHNAIGGPFTTATLGISAFDVDNPSSFPGTVDDEIDEIQLFNNQTMAWETIGILDGTTNSFSYTTFALGASWFDEIASGLMVQILIDQLDTGFWGVSLAKSVLSIDGAPLPDPNPSPVPVPAAVWLFGSALLGLIGYGRRKKTA